MVFIKIKFDENFLGASKVIVVFRKGFTSIRAVPEEVKFIIKAEELEREKNLRDYTYKFGRLSFFNKFTLIRNPHFMQSKLRLRTKQGL